MRKVSLVHIILGPRLFSGRGVRVLQYLSGFRGNTEIVKIVFGPVRFISGIRRTGKKLGEIYTRCDDNGYYASDEDREDAMRLLDKLKAGQAAVSGKYTDID